MGAKQTKSSSNSNKNNKKKKTLRKKNWTGKEIQEQYEQAEKERRLWRRQLRQQLRLIDRKHAFEKMGFGAQSDGVDVKCRVCTAILTSALMVGTKFNEGYRCSVCKSNRLVICTRCFDSLATDVPHYDSISIDINDNNNNNNPVVHDSRAAELFRFSALFHGCEGENGRLSEEAELALLKELQDEDSDLAIECRPNSFVPSVEGNALRELRGESSQTNWSYSYKRIHCGGSTIDTRVAYCASNTLPQDTTTFVLFPKSRR